MIPHFHAGLQLKRRETIETIPVQILLLLETSQLSRCALHKKFELNGFEFNEDGSVESIFGKCSLHHKNDSHSTSNSENIRVPTGIYASSSQNSPNFLDLNQLRQHRTLCSNKRSKYLSQQQKLPYVRKGSFSKHYLNIFQIPTDVPNLL